MRYRKVSKVCRRQASPPSFKTQMVPLLPNLYREGEGERDGEREKR